MIPAHEVSFIAQGKECSSKDRQKHQGVGAATQFNHTLAPQSAVKQSRKLRVKV